MAMVAIEGAISDAIETMTPTSRTATTEPSSEPMPPITVTTKASDSTEAPISGLTARIGAASTPASAASPAPTPKITNHRV